MNKEQSILVRFTTVALLLVLVFPLPVLAGDGVAPNAPAITANGVSLPQTAPFASTMVASSTVITNPWSVILLYDEDISISPIVATGTPTYDPAFGNGTSQTTGDCGDADLKTYCFTYIPQPDIEAAIFWFFRISGATDTSGEYMATTTYRFILDTGGPILTLDALSNHVILPTISGSSSYGSALVDIQITSSSITRTYQTTAASNVWSYTLLAGDELSEGSYTVTASSTDQYNNRGAEVSGTFVIDTSAPTVSITSGTTDGGYTSSSPVSFSFDVTDATTTTTLCSWDDVAGACTSPATSTLADGSHTFSISATDAYNNTGATTTRTFTLDTVAPALAEVAVIATSTDTTPEYSFTSAEAGALAFVGACSAATSTVGVGTTTLTFAALAVGSYSSCSLSVTDVASNTGTLAISPFAIEAVPEPPAPAPAPSGGGGGGGGGIIGGPLSVGYQIPYLPPPAPAPAPSAPEPQAVQVTVGASTGGSAVAAPEPAAPTQSIDTDVREISNVQTQAAPAPAAPSVRAPVAVVTPWDTPAGEQINLASAAATGFQLPSWIIILAALLLAAFITYLFLWRRV